MSLFSSNPADLMRTAISDAAFCQWFAKCGGGFLLDQHPLFTRAELIERFCMSDAALLALPHRYWPLDKQRNPLTSERIAELLKTLSLADVRALGRDMTEEDVALSVKSRNYNRDRAWGFYVAYRHKLPPQHPKALSLLRERYQTPWVMDELDVLNWGIAA